MRAPVSVPPVNEIAETSGWATIASPALPPLPCTIFSTPGGRPHSILISPSRAAVAGVSSLGLATTGLPAASAGAIFQVKRYRGRFQGEITPAIPTGCRITVLIACSPVLSISLRSVCAASAKKRRFCTARGISMVLASAIGLPLSIDSSRDSSSDLASTASASACKCAPRS